MKSSNLFLYNYFQRMFSYVIGITLAEYIRRRRMTKAALELQTKKFRIMDVALKYGYNSATSFNRAFKSIQGVTPVAVLNGEAEVIVYPRISFSINIIGGIGVKYRIEKKGPIRIVGRRIKLSESQEENFNIVPKFWNEVLESDVFDIVLEKNNQAPKGVLGVTVYNNEESYYYIGSSTTQELKDEQYYEYAIPAATWVIFESNGRFKESIQEIYKIFLAEWLPTSNYTYAELPDIEVYPIVDKRIKKGNFQVWIAIKENRG